MLKVDFTTDAIGSLTQFALLTCTLGLLFQFALLTLALFACFLLGIGLATVGFTLCLLTSCFLLVGFLTATAALVFVIVRATTALALDLCFNGSVDTVRSLAHTD